MHEVRLVDLPDLAHHCHPLVGGVDAIERHQVVERDPEAEAAAAADQGRGLRMAALAAAAAERRAGLGTVMGLTTALEDARKEIREGLALMVTEAPASEFVVDYWLAEDDAPSHVSVVSGYEGGGDDARKDAFLIQSAGEGAAFSVWRHNGDTWALRPDPPVAGLPLRGTLRVAQSQDTATVHVGPRRIGTYPLRRPGPSRMGIRALNAIFRPARQDG